jgi:hypothetical protein
VGALDDLLDSSDAEPYSKACAGGLVGLSLR